MPPARASCPIVCLLMVACAANDYPQLYQSAPHAPSFSDTEIANLDRLGPVVVDQGANFSVYSERATRVDLLLFDDPDSRLPTWQFPMRRFGNVWSVYVEGVGVGQHYGYIAWGPNWPEDSRWYPGSSYGFRTDVDDLGNRFNPNKLLFDPYAKAFHRDHDWSRGSLASGPHRTQLTYGAASKSVIVQSQYRWSEHESTWRQHRQIPNWTGHRWSDLILYEVHPKGFTADAASGVEHPGTYRGFGEMAPYLADLGITAVELLPVHEKPLDGGYWGYQTLSFFMPEISYASRREREEVIDEFKWMVDQLHQHGIEVILDVVYNHTGEGGLWRYKLENPGGGLPSNIDSEEVAGIYSYRGLDNNAYYALEAHNNNRTYWNITGVGNQTRCNHLPVRRMMMDSLRYWAEEMHVDGFRFDLAPILGLMDGAPDQWGDPAHTVLQEIIDDPILQKYNTRIISEPWAFGYFKMGCFPRSSAGADVAWYDWNARFRDLWRAFVNDVPCGGGASCDPGVPYHDRIRYVSLDHSEEDGRNPKLDIGTTLTGSSPLFTDVGRVECGTAGSGTIQAERRPYHAVNFVTVHDGFTMYDLFTYWDKNNLCGPLNPVCCVNPFDSFCDPDSGEKHNRSRGWGHEPFKRQLMRNLFVAMMISHGTPMILGGDEWMRTQLGNNNAYTTQGDNEWNWFAWGVWRQKSFRLRMHDFVRQLIRLRKAHAYALAPATYGGGAPFAWKNDQNNDMQEADWGQKHVMLHYYDPGHGPELAILINMELYDPNAAAPPETVFTLPAGRDWVRIVDTQLYYDTDGYFEAGENPNASANILLDNPVALSGDTYGVKYGSIVILRAP